MSGGNLNQARRRSVDGQTQESSSTLDLEECQWEFNNEPTDEEVIHHLSRSCIYGGSEKKKTLIKRLIVHRYQLIQRIGVVSRHIQESADMSIPLKDTSTKNG